MERKNKNSVGTKLCFREFLKRKYNISYTVYTKYSLEEKLKIQKEYKKKGK